MEERHPPVELEQPGGLGRSGRLGADREPRARAPQQRLVADGVGRGGEHQPPRVGRQRLEPSQEACLDAAEQGHCGNREAARELGRREAARQFQQGQRVAARLGQDPLAHALVERAPDDGVQQRAGVVVAQPFDDQLRQPGQLLGRRAGGEDQRDRLGQQAARDERERLQRRAVEPLRVVDTHNQRPLARHLGEQAEDRQPDQEAILGRTGRQPERDFERIALRRGQVLAAVEQRRAQLVQPRERELHLGVDPGRPRDPERVRALDGVVEQRRLPDARVAAHHENAAAPVTKAGEEAIDRLTLVPASAQHVV